MHAHAKPLPKYTPIPSCSPPHTTPRKHASISSLRIEATACRQQVAEKQARALQAASRRQASPCQQGIGSCCDIKDAYAKLCSLVDAHAARLFGYEYTRQTSARIHAELSATRRCTPSLDPGRQIFVVVATARTSSFNACAKPDICSFTNVGCRLPW